MELVNHTPVVAHATVSEMQGIPLGIGCITAKATYRFDDAGAATLDADDPFPLFDSDQETELGLLPRDDLQRQDPAFEVVLLGAAYAAGGKPSKQRSVALSVGAVRRELAVFGDRRWLDRDRISPPVPFERMPLTLDRAFGGTREVLVDRDAGVDVSDPGNRYGRGFDPGPAARALGELLKAPAGYPRYDEERPLPNVEDPRRLIARWDDAPDPACWAALPMDTLLHLRRAVHMPKEGEPLEIDVAKMRSVFELDWMKDGFFHRAHPDWVIALPPRGARVEMEGLRPEGTVGFALPALRVVADFVFGEATGSRALDPHMLVLLPEERRFYLVYRHRFNLAPHPEDLETSFRLRLEESWYGG